MTEHQLQRACADFLDRALPPDAWWSSLDSAGRGAIQGARMKRRGVHRGMLDVIVLYQRLTIWFELKSAKGKPTIEQRAFIACALNAGHNCYVVRSMESVEFHLLSHGIPLRCRLSA